MGQALIRGYKPGQKFPQLLDETQIFATWEIADVRELWRRFQRSVYGFALVEAQFESILSFKESVRNHVDLELLFDILDNDHDGRIDGLEFLGGLALCCQGSFEEKAKFCFEMYDFNLNAQISKKEMTMMIMASICGMNVFTGGVQDLEPSLPELERIVDDAFMRADRDRSGLISYDEFVVWARSNRDLMAGLETLNKLATDAKLECVSEDSASDEDESYLSDAEPSSEWGTLSHTGPTKAEGSKTTSALRGPVSGDADAPESRFQFSNVGVSAPQWLGQVHEPTSHVHNSAKLRGGPGANLELCWAFGYRAQNSRNNLRYLILNENSSNGAVNTTNSLQSADEVTAVVYPTASLGVVYDLRDRSQRFYQGHREEITCIALHPSGLIAASGDVASNIHLWSTQTMACLSIIQSLVKGGIQHLCFSPTMVNGDRLAAVHADADSTIALFDSNNGSILASARCAAAPQNVHGIAYSPNGDEIVVVGTKVVKFFIKIQNTKRALDFQMGKIGRQGKKQTFFCAAYLTNDELVVGCADGSLYRFKNHIVVQTVQGHSLNEPVLSMFCHLGESLLITGGKDCNVKSWDFTLKEVGVTLDISEDLDGDGRADCGAVDASVTSVQYHAGKILIGTKGSDIFEATLAATINDSLTLSRIGWGHSSGELWGASFHPVRDKFVTVGDDKTLRIWSVRSHEQLKLRSLPMPARAVSYNNSGDILCIGMVDGSVAIIEADSPTLRVSSTWKHCESAITSIAYSNDNKILAIGSEDTNLYLYRRTDDRRYVRQAVCQGHIGAVRHIDFSANGQYLSSACNMGCLLYWDIRGNEVKDAAFFRDESWLTNGVRVNPYGWATQGIALSHHDSASSNKNANLNTLCALPEVGDIITGDSRGCVKLYRYPSLQADSLSQGYVGHAGEISRVGVNSTKRCIISIGKTDRTILLWKHETELVDDSDNEDSEDEGVNPFGRPEAQGGDIPNEMPSVVERTVLQEAVNTHKGAEEIDRIIRQSYAAHGDTVPNRKPWQATVNEPTFAAKHIEQGTTDVDFELAWVHAYRSHDCRNNLRYSSSGKIVYAAATLGVVLNKSTGKQQFLQAAHSDEIIGLTAHPNGHIFATGEAGRVPVIVVWSSADMRVIARISGVHSRGVPLLAFNSQGNMLASIGMDTCNVLVIHDWTNGVEIMRTAVDKGKLYCLTYLVNARTANGSNARTSADSTFVQSSTTSCKDSPDIVVTGGHRHLSYWTNVGQNVKAQRGIWGDYKRETLLCVVSPAPHVVISGSLTGGLVIWYKYRAAYQAHAEPFVASADDLGTDYPHRNASILAMWAIPGNITSIASENGYGEYHDEPISMSTIYTQHRDELINGYTDRCCRLITGDRNGVVAIWRVVCLDGNNAADSDSNPSAEYIDCNGNCTLRLILMKKFNTKDLTPTPVHGAVRSVCERDGMLLIGVQGCEIYEVVERSLPFVHGEEAALESKTILLEETSNSFPPGIPQLEGAVRRAMGGTESDTKTAVSKLNPPPVPNPISSELPVVPYQLKSERLIAGHSHGELWGLCAHPTAPYFFTAGDDCTVRCWSLETQSLVSYFQLPDKSRCLAINPNTDGNILNRGATATGDLAIGFNSGYIWIVPIEMFFLTSSLQGQQVYEPSSTANMRPFKKLEQSSRAGWKWLQELTYSFDGRVLAAGSHDGSVYMYDVPAGYTYLTVLKGHAEHIAHVQFGVLLQHNPQMTQTFDPQTCMITTTTLMAATTSINAIKSKSIVSASIPSAAPIHVDESNPARSVSPVSENSPEVAGEEKSHISAPISTTTPVEENTNVMSDHETIPQQGPCPVRLEDLVVMVSDGKANVYYYTYRPTRKGLMSGGKSVSNVVSSVQYQWTLETNMAKLKDSWWATWTSPYGWPVQGIWSPTYDGTDVSSVARSHSYQEVPVIVTGDNFGRVRLFNYPSLTPGAPDKCYLGHCGHITRVVFSYNDRFCITIGGEDRAIFIWATDVLDEIRERKALIADVRSDTIAPSSSAVSNSEKLLAFQREAADQARDDEGNSFNLVKKSKDKSSVTSATSLGEAFAGDQNMAVVPWKGAVREPTGWKEPEFLGQAPDASLELKFVYGYRGWDCRNNIGFAGNRHLVTYHIAAIGIVFNTQTQTQIHSTEHDNDITCLAVHPDGHIIGTGEIGKKPKIVLWDANTGVTIRILRHHTNGISSLCFSLSGNLLISIGMDVDRCLAVHNIHTGALVGKAKAGRGVELLTLTVGYGDSSDAEKFVTGGKGHIKFWEMPASNAAGGELSCKGGLYNNKSIQNRNIVSSAFLDSDCITGMSDGTLVHWKERCATRFVDAHTGPVMAMCAIPSRGSGADNTAGARLISGGKDGWIHVWSYKLVKVWSLDLSNRDNIPASINAHIRALAFTDNRIIVGTKGCEIFEINMLANTVNPAAAASSNTNANPLFKLVEGHFDDRAEVWALATHPIAGTYRFVTGGDDMTVRLYDSKAMIQIAMTNIQKKVRSVAWRPDGSHIAVGCYDGRIKILSPDLQSVIAEVSPTNSWIAAMQYSPDGQQLAIGAHDTKIYILDTKTYSVRTIFSGNSGAVSHLDWSLDGKTIQSASNAYELLFWSVATGSQIKAATSTRDVKWKSFTSILGWPVQGIWPSGADFSDVNSCDRSPNQRYLVTADDNHHVKLFSYPVCKEGSQCKVYQGHSEHVPTVRFSTDGLYVFSVGGLDKSVIQYEVKGAQQNTKP